MINAMIYTLCLVLSIFYSIKLIGSDFRMKKISSDSIYIFFIVSLPVIGRYESLMLFLLSFFFLVFSRKFTKDRLIVVYFLIILIGTFSIFNSIDVLTSFRELLIVLSYFLISIAATNFVYRLGDCFLERSIKYIIVSGLIISSLLFVHTLSLFQFREHILLLKTLNHFSYYIGGILIISLILLNEKSNSKYYSVVPVIVFAVSLIIGDSRGAYISIITTYVIYAIIQKKYKITFSVFSIVAIAIINYNKLPLNIRYTLESITNKRATFSNVERIEMWNASINMIKNHPLIGVGIDNWRYYYSLPQYNTSVYEYSQAHNFYLQTGSEIGLIGLGLYVLIYVYSIRFSLFVIKKSKSSVRKVIALANMMVIIYTAFYSLFNNPLFNSKPAMFFFVIVGLNAGAYKLTAKEVKENEN